MTPNTALVSIGNGFGAWFRDGLIHVVGPHDMARIERERVDGPRWCEAVRQAGSWRQAAFGAHGSFHDGNYGTGAYLNERLCGIPEQWSAADRVPFGLPR